MGQRAQEASFREHQEDPAAPDHSHRTQARGGSELADATRELAGRLARGSPLAYRAAKAAVYESANLPFASLLDFEARNQRAVSRSADVTEGIRAFLERRKPELRGR